MSRTNEIGALCTARFADQVDVTAGGAGDNTESNGVYVDRSGYDSAKLVVSFEAVLGATETLSIGANIQDDADGSGTGVDYGSAYTSAVVATGGAGGSTERGVVELDFDLRAAKQYIRSQITPDLSAATTDTARIHAVWVLGPGITLPVS